MVSIHTPKRFKKKDKWLSFKLQLLVFSIVLFGLAFYDAYRPISGRQILPLSLTGVIAGMVVQSIWLTDKWVNTLLTIVGALVLSIFFSMSPSKHSSYNFSYHIELWPFLFIIFYSLIALFVHGKELIPKLSEGITFIQSLAIIYWIADRQFFETANFALKLSMIVGIGFTIYSIVHAFTYLSLSNTSRLILSLWSSIIMMLLALDNLYGVNQNDSIENISNFWGKAYEWMSYFLLGISSIYMIKNCLMLIGFLPSKGKLFNRAYFQSIQKLSAEHIDRYSDEQLKIKHSVICIVFAGSIFTINYYCKFVPSHMAIWLVFFIVPLLLKGSDEIKLKKI